MIIDYDKLSKITDIFTNISYTNISADCYRMFYFYVSIIFIVFSMIWGA